MHGVVNSFQDPEDGGERFLQVITAVTALTVLQQFLRNTRQEVRGARAR